MSTVLESRRLFPTHYVISPYYLIALINKKIEYLAKQILLAFKKTFKFLNT